MKRVVIAAMPILLSLTGCGLIFVPGLNDVAVRLVNNGDLDVEVTVAYSGDDADSKDDLVDNGTKLTFTVPAGEVRSFSRSCGQLGSIVIEDADLLVVGAVGPQTDSNVVRMDGDFDCGQTVTFTFDHSALLIDFDVTSSVSN